MARLIRMPRTIRARLTWILAIPTTLLLGFTGLEVAARFDARSGAHTAARQVELALAAQDLVHELQRERGLTAGLLGGEARFRGELHEQRRRVDEARTALEPLLADPARRGVPRLRDAVGRLSGLGATRSSADAGQTTRQEGFTFYTAVIAAINDALSDPEAEGGDPRLRRDLEALWALARAQEAAAQGRDTLIGALAAGGFAPEEYVRFIETRAARQDGLARFTRLAVAEHAGAVSAAQQSRAATTMGAIELRAAASPRGRNLTITTREWWSAATTFLSDLREVRRSVGEQARARAREAEARDTRELIAFAVLGGVLLLGTLLLGLVTSRSILRPLRRLTQEANEVAERRLPEAVARIQATADPAEAVVGDEPVPESRQDELAAVTRALGNVHRTALRLAAEQTVLRHNTAESLANLGRRNQTLVRRQLGFISALERDESDPAALANLFELDHLATRIRRNAESLLILVGERVPRQAAEPVAMGDVLRSALAEVEDYRRVVLRRVDHDMVRGAVVAEVAHLLAELIENALVFSAQDQDVEIQARCDATEYHIAIVDQGVGMTAEELATANARLRGEQSFLVAPTRQLGLYVVGRLAQRLGIKVWLHDSPLAGITARVVLPVDLLVRDGAAAAPGASANGSAQASPGAAGVSGAAAEPAAMPAVSAAGRAGAGAASTVPGSPAAAAPGTSAPGTSAASAGATPPAASHPAEPAAEPEAVSAPGSTGPSAPGTPPPVLPTFVPLPTSGLPSVREPAASVRSPAPDPAAGASSGPSPVRPAAPATPPPARPAATPAPPKTAPRVPSAAPASTDAQPALRAPIPLHAKPPYRFPVQPAAAGGAVSGGGAVSEGRAAAGDGERETTPNGLVRRVPRTDRPRSEARNEDPAYGTDPHEPIPEGPVDRVRSMLNDYRAGTRQSEQVGVMREEQ